MTANRNFKNFPPNGQNAQEQLNTDLVTCIKCGGQNHKDNMTCDPATDSYTYDFCQLDESEPILFHVIRLVVQQ